MDKINLKKVKYVRITSIVDNSADRSFAREKDYPKIKRYQLSDNMYQGLMPIRIWFFNIIGDTWGRLSRHRGMYFTS